jgi:hypothetical protein
MHKYFETQFTNAGGEDVRDLYSCHGLEDGEVDVKVRTVGCEDRLLLGSK